MPTDDDRPLGAGAPPSDPPFHPDDPAHHRWLEEQGRRLLDFGRAAALPTGGFGWLDARGAVTPGLPARLYVTCRMTHAYSLGTLLGVPGSEALVDHGLAALTGPFRDAEHGGWFGAVDDAGRPTDDTKAAYPHAFVVLAAASASVAGRPGARALLDEALGVVERHFWDEDAGMVVETWDRTFSTLDPYRGMNSAMHAVEAFTAASAATGDDRWLDRALRMTRRALAAARDHDWRLPEHYDEHWRPRLEHNSEHPDDPFRPYGSTMGHWLEWSRLALHVRAALRDGGRTADAEGLLDGAVHLVDAAVAQGWAVDGAPGFAYTVDWDGRPRVRQRLHWVLCEALGAATALWQVTGDPVYREWYAEWWRYADRYLVDRVDGSWHHELDPANRPAATIRPGKADVYHALQATLLPRVPLGPSLATSVAAARRPGRAPVGAGPAADPAATPAGPSADPPAGLSADPLAGYEDWPAWVRTRPRRRDAGPLADRVRDALGIAEPVRPAPVVTTLGSRAVDGVRLERVEWHVGFGPRTRAWVARPDTADVLPGVLALHCHGGVKSVGADQLVTLGDDASPQAVRLQRDYYGGRAPAVELARRGVVVLAHDAFLWGSRRFPLTERTAKLAAAVTATEALWREQGLDPDGDARYDAAAGYHEDTVAKAAGVLGTSLTGTVVHDDLVALDVLAAMPGVDPDRLGAFGFSGGGGRSVLLAALDDRVRAHVVTCMMSTFEALVPRYLDAHSWLLWGPALPGLGEWPDLLAPRPGRSVLVQYALRDALFPGTGMRDAHERLAAAHAGTQGYRAAFWDRPHVFDAGMQDEAFAFLAAGLGAGATA